MYGVEYVHCNVHKLHKNPRTPSDTYSDTRTECGDCH